MKLLFYSALILALSISPAVSQEQKLTKESFLKQLQGEWEIESRVNGGSQWKPDGSKKVPTMKVEGNKIYLPEGIGKLPYDLENITVKENVVSLLLVRRLGSRAMSHKTLAAFKDGKFILVTEKFRGRWPESIEPSKTNLVQTWKRTEQKSNE